jgi:hypothetical protein
MKKVIMSNIKFANIMKRIISTKVIKVRGNAASIQYLIHCDDLSYGHAESIEKADMMSLVVGEKNCTLIMSKPIIKVDEGDDVDIAGVVDSQTGILQIIALKNHTSGNEWKFGIVSNAFGF